MKKITEVGPEPQVLTHRSSWVIATGFGSGLLPFAPGTWGSLAALTAWIGIVILGLLLNLRKPLAVFVFLGPFLLWWIGSGSLKRIQFELEKKDPPYIVIDEWVGMWIALMPLASVIARDPFVSLQEQLLRCALPFCLFRLLDIWKPGPIGRAQKLGGSSGIMMDDVLAGIATALLTKPSLIVMHQFFID
jgi:phosphatidylglycerophosphatase A